MLLGFSACGNDDSVDTDEKPIPVSKRKISKIEWWQIEDKDNTRLLATETFKYNSAGVISESFRDKGYYGSDVQTSYKYQFSNNEIMIEHKLTGTDAYEDAAHEKIYLKLNSQGLIEESHREDLATSKSKEVLHYYIYKDGRLSKTYYQDMSSDYFNFYYNEQGLLSEINDGYGKNTLWYNDQENKLGFSIVPNVAEYNDGGGHDDFIVPNNILYMLGYFGKTTSKLVKQYIEKSGSYTDTYSFSYDFDKQGYPIAIYKQESSRYDSDTEISNYTIKIEYLD